MEHDNINKTLKVALVQTPLFWESPEANRAHLEELIWKIHNQSVHLIILPEMFNTGFSVSATHLAEPMYTHTHKWMIQMAAQTGAVIAGSIMIKASANQVTNRLLWVAPDGKTDYYDKRHTFSFAHEHIYISRGSALPVFELNGWRVCPQICYDLRFPVFVRNQNLKYDIIIYVANWPEPRINAWDILLPARAIENSAYVIGVNRTGTDGKNLKYPGHSAIYDFKGNTLAKSGKDADIIIKDLHLADLLDYRKKFPVHQDADAFNLIL